MQAVTDVKRLKKHVHLFEIFHFLIVLPDAENQELDPLIMHV